MGRLLKLTLLIICMKTSHAMIMRNNALMSKMVSHFQQDNNLSLESNSYTPKPNVINLMQSVLCRNFPSIPCEMITRDETLRKLIQRSIQQISQKKLTMEKTTTTSPSYHLTLFPIINSEDLSHYLEVSENGFYDAGKKSLGKKKPKKNIQSIKLQSGEKTVIKKINKKESKRTTLNNGRKRIRKFYPHKIKYKDKNMKKGRQDFGDNTEEKLSMSVEMLDMMPKKHLNYKMEPADPPVWRIDYMKHGEPDINVFGYNSDRLKGKVMKAGPNVVVDQNVLEQVARRDVLHPDLYIKNNYVKKNTENSDNME